MFEVIQQSSATAARRRLYFKVFDSADAVSGKVIASLVGVKMKLSKNGAAAVSSTADIVAVDTVNEPGKHYLELTINECDTIGQLVAELPPGTGYLAASGQASIVGFDPYQDGASVSAIATGVRTELTVELADVVAIKAKTDNLPPDPADESLIIAATDALGTAIGAVPAAVRTNLATELGRIDAAISSRAAATAISGGVTLTAGERTAVATALLASIIETNGATTLSVKQALQLAAALTGGKVSGITAGTGMQTTVLRSATDLQTIATYTDDELGNRSNVVLTTP